MIFDIDGMQTRARRKPCSRCGAMTECDVCWEHVRDYTPFVIWHCLLCRMPQARFDGGVSHVRCEFCGWDEYSTVGAEK